MARPGGNPDFRDVRNTDTKAANNKRRKLADDYSRETGRKLFEAMTQQSGMNLVQYAEWLNAHDWPTRKGGQWTATQVDRVFKRLGLVAPQRRPKAKPRRTPQP